MDTVSIATPLQVTVYKATLHFLWLIAYTFWPKTSIDNLRR